MRHSFWKLIIALVTGCMLGSTVTFVIVRPRSTSQPVVQQETLTIVQQQTPIKSDTLAVPSPQPEPAPAIELTDATPPLAPSSPQDILLSSTPVKASAIPLLFTPSLSHFSLHKMGTDKGPTLLIVGGIQGDEPGAFSAASLIASHYHIKHGSVWVIPDLNIPSILQRHRGLRGDMNRKFAAIAPTDPDYHSVTRIKEIIIDKKVDVILNLHDGSGFYRPTYEDSLRNPKRWGQSVIIDQNTIAAPQYGDLHHLAKQAIIDVNKQLVDKGHTYYLHNTHTALGDKEMEKTLTYFAICNGKPAFGLEASKEFTTEYRSYYHLLLIESFMRQMGISFTRNFPLTPKNVQTALNSNLVLTAYNSKLILPLDNARKSLGVLPLQRGTPPRLATTMPLLHMLPEKNGSWRIAYGNKTLTRFRPQLMEFDNSLSGLTIHYDQHTFAANFGDIIPVSSSFMVEVPDGYRVNAIGARKERNGTEAGVELFRNDFSNKFSLDTAGTLYRVEVYKEKAFVGMVLVRFADPTNNTLEAALVTNGQQPDLDL